MEGEFTEREQALLAPFVTSTEDQIYCITNNVPIEVSGAFGSFFSRNPKDSRHHYLDALEGRIKGYEEEVDNEWIIRGDFKEPSTALTSGRRRAQDFNKRVFGGFGDKSVANIVWIPTVATGVSQLWARELEYDQLAFCIEQSTRYVNFKKEGMCLDPEVMASEHGPAMEHALETQLACYQELTKAAMRHYKRGLPFEEWITHQSDEVKNDPEQDLKRAWRRVIKGKAFDISRMLLPQAIKTNIAFVLDARSTESNIASMKGHPLAEVRRLAEIWECNAGMIVPSLLKYTGANPQYSPQGTNYHTIPQELTKHVEVISAPENGLELAVASRIYAQSVGGNFGKCLRIAEGMDWKQKMEIIHGHTERRKRHDEWTEGRKPLDLVKILVEIQSDIGAIRDLRRHQKPDRQEPLYSSENGYYLPDEVLEIGPEARDIYLTSIDAGFTAHAKMMLEFPHQSQYILPMATNHSITFSLGLEQLQYLTSLRSKPHGHFSYRKDAVNLTEEACKAMPWLLGLERYPRGKSFAEVYANAPCRDFLRVDTGETGDHT